MQALSGGVWAAGDKVVGVLPAGLRARIEAVETADGPLGEAVPPQSVTIRLADDVDVSRGNLLADPDRPPIVAREVEAHVWMSERPLRAAGEARRETHDAFRARDRQERRTDRYSHARGTCPAPSGSR